MTITRRTMLTAVSAAAAAQAQRTQPPNWKPKLGVLCLFSDRNLEFVKSEGFTSMQLRAAGPLDPDHQDDSLIASIKDKIQRAGIMCHRSPSTAITSIRIRRSAIARIK